MQNEEDVIHEIIDAAVEVKSVLGAGFLESVYQHALADELKRRSLKVQLEQGIDVFYKGKAVGSFRADLVVEDCIIIELKCTTNITIDHELQTVNYLKATGIDNGLIINFGHTPIQIKRKYRVNKR